VPEEANRQLRSGILSSLIAALIFICVLEPVLRLLGRLCLDATGALAVHYQDRVFAEAAAGQPDYAWVLTMLVVGLMWAVMTSGIAAFVSTAMLPHNRKANGSDIANPRRSAHALRRRLASMILGWFLVVSSGLFLLVDGWLRLSAFTSYNQRMAVVAPLITDQQYKELRAKWALMRSRRDYESIQEQLAAIAKAHQIVLPANTLYDF
jgi:hypothetical protein